MSDKELDRHTIGKEELDQDPEERRRLFKHFHRECRISAAHSRETARRK